MKKKALATFLSVCMLATVAVPTAIVSATTDSGDAGTSSNQPTEQKSKMNFQQKLSVLICNF